MGSTTVCTAPRRGKSRILPVRNTTPKKPPAQIHGGAPHAAESPKCPRWSTSTAANSVAVPTANEIMDDENGVPVDSRRRVLMTVWTGTTSPATTPSRIHSTR